MKAIRHPASLAPLLIVAVLALLGLPGMAPAQDMRAELTQLYGAECADAVAGRVTTVQSLLGSRYLELLRHPGVFWHADELISFGQRQGRASLDAMSLAEVQTAFGRSLGNATVFRGVRLSQAEMKLVLQTGFKSNALRFAEAPGNPAAPVTEGGASSAPMVESVMAHLNGPGQADRYISVSENVAISRHVAGTAQGKGEVYLFRMEIPELSLIRTSRVMADLGVTPSQVQILHFGTFVDLTDPKTELLAVDLIPRDSIKGVSRSPFLTRLWELRQMLQRFASLSPKEMGAVLKGGVLTALAPVTQFGRALKEAGIYKQRSLLVASARAAGVEPGALGGLKQKPAADLLDQMLTDAGVAEAKRAELVAKYGGAPRSRALSLETNGVRLNLNQPYGLDRGLIKAGIDAPTRHAILLERSRGEFRDIGDFEVRMASHGELKGQAGQVLGKVVDGGAPSAPGESGPRAPETSFRTKATARLRDFMTNSKGGRSVLPGAAQKYFAGPMQNLLTIMCFQAALQYRATGRVDVAKAVTSTLDSPQVWAGMAAAGASAAALESLRRTLAKEAGARAVFAKMLSGLPGSIAAFAAWEIGTGYVNKALEGVNVPGKKPGDDVAVSDMFKHPEVAGQVMGNLAKLAVSPRVQMQVLGKVFKERILTAEFFFTAAGMWAGGKIGTFAGVKVGAWAGAAFGPVGIGVGAVAGGVVGGVAGGIIGGFGGAWAGSAIDTWMARRAFSKASEALEKAVADPAKRKEMGNTGVAKCLDALSEARQKLVDKLSTDFAGKAKRYMSEKDLPSEKPIEELSPVEQEKRKEQLEKRNKGIMARQREVEASRLAVLDVYRVELDLLGKMIEGARARGEDDASLIERENKAMMEMSMFLVGSSQVVGPLPDAAMPVEVLGGPDQPGEERPDLPPSYQGLPEPAY